jgi:hypothetical protein
MEERLSQEGSNVATSYPVAHAPAVTFALDEAGQAELGKVLAGDRRAASGGGRQRGDVRFVVAQRPKDTDPGGIGEQREGSHCGLDLGIARDICMPVKPRSLSRGSQFHGGSIAYTFSSSRLRR